MSRCGSRVAASDMTTKVTCPGSRRFMPAPRDRIRQFGGKMLDTRTRLQAAMPADLSASSNEVSFSRCLPTPLVKNISFGTNPSTSRSLSGGRGLNGKQKVRGVQEVREVLIGSYPSNPSHHSNLSNLSNLMICLAVLTISPIK